LEEEQVMGEPLPRLRRQQDDQVRRLTDHYLSTHHLPATAENQARFVAVYDCFLRATPQEQRSAERLDQMVCTAFGLRDTAAADPAAAGQIAAELAALSARYEEEQQRRREEEELRKKSQDELRVVSGAVSTAYQDLSARLAVHRLGLTERATAVAEQEADHRARLTAIAELERDLKTQLEHRLHRDATAALEAQVAALSGELAAVRAELGDLATEGADDSPYPLAAAVRRLAAQAASAGLDALTGLATRASFNQAIAECSDRFRSAARAGRMEAENYTVLLLAIDHFKAVNQAHGHVTGDRLLAAVGERLRHLRRGMDRAYRFGGDQFACILPRTLSQGAWNVAEILRDQIADLEITAPTGERLGVTVSVGISDAVACGAAVVHCANEAMRAAKQEGRNRTVAFTDAAFVAPFPRQLPADFVAEVRHRLLCEELFAMVSVVVTGDQRGEVVMLLYRAFPGPTADDGDQHFLLAEDTDGAAAIRRLEEATGGAALRAGATDTDEIPDARALPPAARAQLLLTQLVELLA